MTTFSPLVVRNSLENPQVPISSPEVLKLFDAESTKAGPSVDEKGSLAISSVWRAVTLISGTIASLPLKAYKSDGAVREQMSDGSIASSLLSNPHPDMTQYEWLELLLGHVLLWGNAYCLLVWTAGGKPYLMPVHPSTVQPSRQKDGTKVYKVDGVRGNLTDANLKRTDDRARVLHIPGFGYDGVKGMSAIRAGRQGFGLAMAAEEFAARLFANGSLSTGILATDKGLTAEQRKALRAEWQQARKGIDKAFDTIFLDGGLKYQQLTIPPADAQFLESRSFQVSEIARWFGVPPFMLMDVEKSTSWGSGIEQQQIGFLIFTLRSWLTRIEQRLTKLLPPEKAYAHFSVEGMLRADSAARAAFYKEMWYLGVFSTNDILAMEERPPVPGGDVRYRPLNMGVLGTSESDPSTPAPAAASARASVWDRLDPDDPHFANQCEVCHVVWVTPEMARDCETNHEGDTDA